MAKVQIKRGYTRVVNALYEALIGAQLPGRHKDVVHSLIRLIYGYGKTTDRVAVSQISDMTGIATRHVRAILSDLEAWNIVFRRGQKLGRANVLGIQKDFDLWTCGMRRGPVQGATPTREVPRKGPPARGRRRGPVQGRGGDPRAGPSKETPPQKERERAGFADPRASVPGFQENGWRAEGLVHLLGRKPGKRSQKVRWLDDELEKIVRDARAAFPKVEPSRAALRAKVEKLVFSYWERRDRSQFTQVLPVRVTEPEEAALPPSKEDLAVVRVCHDLRNKMKPRFPSKKQYAAALAEAGLKAEAEAWLQ